ncbi:MAG: ribonuclease Z [Candidatus Levybacteria bacterium]|nr:ribonuclease Z [Candidatus Levybacteria bacterium]
MKLTFFGTGSSTPTSHKPFRSYAAFSVTTVSDFLLFDIGPGTVAKMIQHGIDVIKNPTHLFISHFHLDHCLDYITLTKARALKRKQTGEETSLQVFGPEGLRELSDDLFAKVKKWDYMANELKAFEILKQKETMEGVVANSGSWKVTCAPIKHYNGVCYRLDTDGKSIVYSGDMGYDETIAELGRNADVAILECSYPSKAENKGLHLCPEEIGELARIGNFKYVILTHMYPACEGREEEMVATIQKRANCEVTVAQDFLEMEL